MYELTDIKRIRKQLGMTQLELARRAQVSQSLVAKIEAGRIDPTYTKVKQIFTALDDLERKDQPGIDQVMSKKILSVKPKSKVKEAITLMRKHQVSQLPVIENNHLVGLVSESSILDALLDGKAELVEDIMKEAPPVVAKNSTLPMVSAVLKHYPLVVVQEHGKLVGVIAKSDLLSKMYRG